MRDRSDGQRRVRGRGRPAVSATAGTTAKFGYTGQATTWQVPAGVTSVKFEAAGGTAGNFSANVVTGGFGADLTGTLAVTPGETLVIAVGGSGSTNAHAAGGWGYNGMIGGPRHGQAIRPQRRIRGRRHLHRRRERRHRDPAGHRRWRRRYRGRRF